MSNAEKTQTYARGTRATGEIVILAWVMCYVVGAIVDWAVRGFMVVSR